MKYKTLILLPLLMSACSLTAPYAELYPNETATETKPTASQTVTASPRPALTSASTCIVRADALNLRIGAGTQYAVIHWLKAGEVLTRTNEPRRGAWMEVTTQDGARGWINSKYCEVTK